MKASTYTSPVSPLDRVLRFYESIGELAAAMGKTMISQHRQAILDLRRMLREQAPGTNWMLVGSIAVMQYLSSDHQRMTHDVDAVVQSDDMKAWIDTMPIDRYNFTIGRKMLAVCVELLHQPDQTPVQLMHPRFVDVPGMFERMHEANIAEGSIPIADASDLLLMKIRSMGGTTRSNFKRTTDRADIIALLTDYPEASIRAESMADANEHATLVDLRKVADSDRNRQDDWLP